MKLKKASFIIASFSLAFLFSFSLFVSWQESTTMDEQAHIPASYTYVKYLDMRLNPEHPPLLKNLAGIPLLFMDVTFPLDSQEWQEGINQQWVLGNRFLHENNAHLITFLSRIPIIFISLLLGFFLFFWTKKLAGDIPAIIAIIFYSFNPNVIAHSHYVTTDIGIACAIFISLYFGTRFIKNPSRKNILFFGFVLGIAQLVKFSAFLLYPFFGFLTLLYAFSLVPKYTFSKETFFNLWKNIYFYWSRLFFASLLSLIPIWILYTINTWNMPDTQLLTLIETQLPEDGIPRIAKVFVLFIFNIPILSSLAEYFLGLAMVFVRVTGGNTYYFLGEVSTTANALYFPTVYLLKETLPILFSLFLLPFLTIKIFFQKYISLFSKKLSAKNIFSFLSLIIQKKIELLSIFFFCIFYGYISITGNLNIGFRHLFPIIPLLHLLGALSLGVFYTHYRKFGIILIPLLLVWTLSIPLFSYPSYLSYYNESVGGSKNGYLYVTDSNYDWGQDLRRLKKWVDHYNIQCINNSEEKPCLENINFIDTLRIDYFGGSHPLYWFGEAYLPWNDSKIPEPGWYAISATYLQESIYKEKTLNEKSYLWTKDAQLVDRAGDSLFIFYLPTS